MNRRLSYVFQPDGVYAIENGQVVASGPTLDHVIALTGEDVHALETVTQHAKQELGGEAHVPGTPFSEEDMQQPAYDGVYSAVKVACSCDCSDCEDGDHCGGCSAGDKKHEGATHIMTPNGLKGKIMGKAVPGLWGPEVSVRMENGHIARLHVAEVSEFITEAPDTVDKLVEIRETLAATVIGDATSLRTRQADLKDVVSHLRQLASTGIDDVLLNEVDSLHAEASYELTEVAAALDHIIASEPYAPTGREYMAVEQASIGGHTGSWLDEVAQDMIREADATDFDKLLNEGPEVFVAGLETAPLGDQSVTRTLASNYIRTKTAAARPEIREKYEDMWLERVEACRRAEFPTRKTAMAKEAATTADAGGADEALFL
jgi:hypothetical protein